MTDSKTICQVHSKPCERFFVAKNAPQNDGLSSYPNPCASAAQMHGLIFMNNGESMAEVAYALTVKVKISNKHLPHSNLESEIPKGLSV
jgi:hypothetical protein